LERWAEKKRIVEWGEGGNNHMDTHLLATGWGKVHEKTSGLTTVKEERITEENFPISREKIQVTAARGCDKPSSGGGHLHRAPGDKKGRTLVGDCRKYPFKVLGVGKGSQ